MNYSKQIHDFVDGGLDQASEEQLFYALSSNEEYRDELKDTIRLEKSFKTRLSDMAPSAHSTVGVFSKLGFEAPGALVPAASQAVKPIGFFAKYGQGVVSGLSTMAVAVLAYFVFLQPGESNSQTEFASNDPSVIQQTTQINSTIPIVSSGDVISESDKKEQSNSINNISSDKDANNSNNVVSNSRDKETRVNNSNTRDKETSVINSNTSTHKYNMAMNADLSKSWANQLDKLSSDVIMGDDGKPYLAVRANYDLTEIEVSKIREFITQLRESSNSVLPAVSDDEEMSNDHVLLALSQIDAKSVYTRDGSYSVDATPDPYKFGHGFNELENTPVPMQSYLPYIDKESQGPIGMSLEIKGNSYWSTQSKSGYEGGSSAEGQQIQVTFLYALDENFSIGADIRKENFYQEFTGTTELGEELIYRQEPLYTSWSAVGRYEYLNDSEFTPMLQLMLGGTATGQTGRILGGVEYSPTQFFSFLFGLEHSTLMFTHKDNTFYSTKLGMNFGVAIKF
jgi:hypothetical protein